MRHKLIWIFAIILIIASASAPALAKLPASLPAQDPPDPILPTGEVKPAPVAWFVEFHSPAVQTGGKRAGILSDRAHFKQDANEIGLQYSQRRSFNTLWNGISIDLDASQVHMLANLPSVKAIYPVEIIPIPEASPLETPEMTSALAMTGADIAQSELGLTGEGIRVAIMDTGIDYDHPDLGGCFGLGCKVEKGWDFVGDAFDGYANPYLSPDDDPMDCNGHGTHVAGIVGAKAGEPGGVTGVAPEVTLGAYKVFGCSGSTFADIMLAAMEKALEDGMHVLNMSIGSAYQWPQYPTAVAADLLVDQGMVVVASIGNSGETGLYSASSPGVGAKVIGVASFDNTHINALTLNVNPGGQQVPYMPITATPHPPTSGASDEVVFVGRGCLAPPNFDPYLASPSGKVALIERGTCTFEEKYQRAFSSGATGVVIYNNVTGIFSGSGVTPREIFGIGISQADGQHILNLLDDSQTVTLSWTGTILSLSNPTGGLISSFSSYGLAPDLSLKPDIGAPGGMIRSTYPLDLGKYAVISGTSMASPHVAGAVALLLEGRPGTQPAEVSALLQNNAQPKSWWGNPSGSELDNVHRQGAGMLQIDKAIQASTRIVPSKIALGESQSGPATYALTVYNNGTDTVTYDLDYINALSTGSSTDPVSFHTSNATVSFSPSSVTVPGDGQADVQVTITPASTPERGQYGGYILFSPQVAGQEYRVPYAGFIGDYQSIQVLTPDSYGFPLLAHYDGYYYLVEEDGHIFSMLGEDTPYVFAQFYHPSTLVRLEILPEGDLQGDYDLTVFQYDYFHRNISGYYYGFTWNGTALLEDHWAPLPNGDYRLKLSVLKALGEAGTPDHWETWTSPFFTIARLTEWGVSLSPEYEQRQGYSGYPMQHVLTVANTGTDTDTFLLDIGPSKWPVELDHAVIENLGPGDSAAVIVEVEVPEHALAGEFDMIEITASSQGGDETAKASALLKVTVEPFYGLMINLEDRSLSGYAGDTVEYVFTVGNFSNLTDSYDIQVNGGKWATSANPQTVGPLVAGEETNMTVSVQIPQSSTPGSRDTARVTIKSKTNPILAGEVELTTSTREAMLFLPLSRK
jgi:minor extracellular serine protease Vpr